MGGGGGGVSVLKAQAPPKSNSDRGGGGYPFSRATPSESKGSVLGLCLATKLGDPFKGVPAGPISLDRACVVSLSARRRPLTSRVRGVVGGFRV